MVDKKLKTAIVGCGRIGTYTRPELRKTIASGWLPLNHAEAILSNEQLNLMALADISVESLNKASERYGVIDIFTDYRQLILSIRPDILSIATRTKGRGEIIRFAVANGVKGIHFEKPISTNMEECIDTMKLVEKNRVKISYGTTRRFMESYRLAKSLIKNGEIGNIAEIVINIGKAPLLWAHPHSTDLLLYLLDITEESSVEYVQAHCTIMMESISENHVDDDPCIDFAITRFVLPDGSYVNGIISSGAGMNTIISGSQGNIIVGADGGYIEINKKRSGTPYFIDRKRIDQAPGRSGTQNAFSDLADSVINGKASPILPSEVTLGLKLLLCYVWSSILDGKRLRMSDLPEGFTVTGKSGDLYA